MRHPNMVGGIINLCTLVRDRSPKGLPLQKKNKQRREIKKSMVEGTEIVKHAMRKGNALGP
jgi:hypothetical protein